MYQRMERAQQTEQQIHTKILQAVVKDCALMKMDSKTMNCRALFFASPILLATMANATITQSHFGVTPSGENVKKIQLVNASGSKVDVITLGAIVQSLQTKDQNGVYDDIVLGFDNVNDYLTKSPYFGAIVGRYANRIANGKFKIEGKLFNLATNNDPGGIPCHLHGGIKGFDKVVWKAETTETKEGPQVKLTYLSKDGEEGYPGNLKVTCVYTWTNSNTLRVDLSATTDKKTPINLAQHSYFNLDGQGAPTILDHKLTLDSENYTPVDAGLIPTGKLESVSGTPFDFRRSKRIGDQINDQNEQLLFGGGYDHNWVLKKPFGEFGRAARLVSAKSGRVMEVYTSEPGIQFYAGNFLDGTLNGKSGTEYFYRSGLCLETQHFPDSPNQPNFPTTILNPGEKYHALTEYRFSVLK